MTFTEHGGRDLEGLTGNGLRGPSAAVDERADVEYGNTTDHGITWGLELGLHGARRGREGLSEYAATVGVRPF